jgi:predicted glycoside hydrolase/deacetylase ChbG (UPF0249 family)
VRLILNADDLGYSPGVNQAIFDLYACGRLSSASAVVNLPHSPAGLEGAAARPGLGLGVHLNLTRGRPCLPAWQVPSLVDGDGAFYGSPICFARAVAGQVSPAEVEAESRAQIERALDYGIEIAHLDSHSHWHILPPLQRLLHHLATEYHVPRVRQADPRRALVPIPLWLAAAPRAPVPRDQRAQPDYLLSLHHWLNGVGESPPLFDLRLRRLLGRPEVTAELVSHPGLADDPEFPPDTLPADRRQREIEFLQSDAFAGWLAEIGAELIGRRAG